MLKISYIRNLKEPRIRKRDGELTTHSITINLTEDEAMIVSDLFFRTRANGGATHSLIRAAVLLLADLGDPSDALPKAMASIQAKRKLASQLAQPDVDRALALLKNFKEAKDKNDFKEQAPVSTKKLRREYVFTPDPRRK